MEPTSSKYRVEPVTSFAATTTVVSSPDPLHDTIWGGAGGGGARTTGEGLANRVHLPQAEGIAGIYQKYANGRCEIT